MTPTIVITRPATQGSAFAAALEQAYGGPLSLLLAPLMEIAPVVPDAPIGAVDHVIFTSANGVAQVDLLQVPKTATAWCVGAKTADVAAAAGFETRTAGGDSAALVDMIKAATPQGRMVHLHGAHVTGSVVDQLQAAGLTCEGRVVYRQDAVPPPEALIQHLKAADPLIIPLFSPRSARLLQAAGPIAAPLTLVALSEAVAAAALEIEQDHLITVSKPHQPELIAAVLAAFRAFLPANMP